MLKYNKQKISVLLATSIAFGLSGCSLFSGADGTEDIDDRYMRSQQGPELQLPANADELEFNDDYRVPEGTVITERNAQGKKLSLEPPQLLLIGGDGIREDKEQEFPTVWVRSDGQQLSDYLNRFILSKSIPVISQDDKNINTDWILSDAESSLGQHLGSYNIDDQRHRFNFIIVAQNDNEVGLQARHVANEQLLDGQWVEVETSKRVARQFLNYFLGFYDGERNKEARARILQEGSIDIRLGTDNNSNVAFVSERDFQTVWQQIPFVLEKLNLDITDRDQSAGLYYFNVREPSSGFWSLFFDSSSDPKVNLEPGDYKIKVESLTASGTSLVFYHQAGELVSSSTIAEIYPEISATFSSRATGQ